MNSMICHKWLRPVMPLSLAKISTKECKLRQILSESACLHANSITFTGVAWIGWNSAPFGFYRYLHSRMQTRKLGTVQPLTPVEIIMMGCKYYCHDVLQKELPTSLNCISIQSETVFLQRAVKILLQWTANTTATTWCSSILVVIYKQ